MKLWNKFFIKMSGIALAEGLAALGTVVAGNIGKGEALAVAAQGAVGYARGGLKGALYGVREGVETLSRLGKRKRGLGWTEDLRRNVRQSSSRTARNNLPKNTLVDMSRRGIKTFRGKRKTKKPRPKKKVKRVGTKKMKKLAKQAKKAVVNIVENKLKCAMSEGKYRKIITGDIDPIQTVGSVRDGRCVYFHGMTKGGTEGVNYNPTETPVSGPDYYTVPAMEFTFFSGAKMLDAASVLFGSKAATPAYENVTDNLPYENMRLEVLYMSASLEFVNYSNTDFEYELWEFTPRTETNALPHEIANAWVAAKGSELIYEPVPTPTAVGPMTGWSKYPNPNNAVRPNRVEAPYLLTFSDAMVAINSQYSGKVVRRGSLNRLKRMKHFIKRGMKCYNFKNHIVYPNTDGEAAAKAYHDFDSVTYYLKVQPKLAVADVAATSVDTNIVGCHQLFMGSGNGYVNKGIGVSIEERYVMRKPEEGTFDGERLVCLHGTHVPFGSEYVTGISPTSFFGKETI